MTSCNHHPIFKFKMLFARNPKYICKNCGAELEMTSQTKMISRVINALTIGILVYLAFKGDFTKSQTNSMLLYFATMGGIIVAFLFLQTLIWIFGKFQEKEPVQEVPDTSPAPDQYDGTEPRGSSDTAEGTSPAADGTDSADGSGTPVSPGTSSGNSQYTQEQLDLMALYESYAKLDRDENEAEAAAAEPVPVPEEETCIHVPSKSWKNYIPGVYDFKCEKCGKVITFSAAQKKKLNLLLLAFSSIILMVSFSNLSMPFWQLILLSLGIVVICSGIQYYFVKKSVFETKPIIAK